MLYLHSSASWTRSGMRAGSVSCKPGGTNQNQTDDRPQAPGPAPPFRFPAKLLSASLEMCLVQTCLHTSFIFKIRKTQYFEEEVLDFFFLGMLCSIAHMKAKTRLCVWLFYLSTLLKFYLWLQSYRPTNGLLHILSAYVIWKENNINCLLNTLWNSLSSS